MVKNTKNDLVGLFMLYSKGMMKTRNELKSMQLQYINHMKLLKKRSTTTKDGHEIEIKKLNKDLESIQTQLESAREQYSSELEHRRRVQDELKVVKRSYDKIKKQLRAARSILFESNSEISDMQRQKLNFLNDTNVKDYQEDLDRSGSILSDIDYDKTGEFNITDVSSDSDRYNCHNYNTRLSKSRKSLNNKRKSGKISQGFIPEKKAARFNYLESSSSSTSLNTLHRCNSGRSLNRQHKLISKLIIKLEPCIACGKRIKFGKSAVRCSNCKSTAHAECKDQLPLPCVPTHEETPQSEPHKYSLEDFTSNEPPFIPAFVIHCVKEIEKRGMHEKGLYRISGNKKMVDNLVDKYVKGGGTPNLTTITDIHVISSGLKKFLRDLNEPILTFALWKSFADASELLNCSDRVATICSLVGTLPKSNRDTLSYLILHLQRVSEKVDISMSTMNLARVFGPCMIGNSGPKLRTIDLADETEKQHKITEKLMSIPCEFWLEYIESNDTEFSSPSSTVKYMLGPLCADQSICRDIYAEPDAYIHAANKRRTKKTLGTPKLYE